MYKVEGEQPKRIIMHWTGGAYDWNEVDRRHYHFLFDGDGKIVKGVSVEHNMKKLATGDTYAAHTGGFNSYSVGVAWCAMYGAVSHQQLGSYPLNERQVKMGARHIAKMCYAWGLDPENPEHLFTHHEAWTLHHVKGAVNDQKWDITVIPWDISIRPDECGDYLRGLVAEYYYPEIVSPRIPPSALRRRPTRNDQ